MFTLAALVCHFSVQMLNVYLTTFDVIACLPTFSVRFTCGCNSILDIQFILSKGDGTGTLRKCLLHNSIKGHL